MQRYKHAFISLTSDSHTIDITDFSLGEKMYNSVVQQVAHDVERQKISAQVHHSDVGGQTDSIARKSHSTGHEPNLISCESVTRIICIADGDDEDHIGIVNSQLG